MGVCEVFQSFPVLSSPVGTVSKSAKHASGLPQSSALEEVLEGLFYFFIKRAPRPTWNKRRNS